MSELIIKREEQGHGGAFFLERDGQRLGELTFTWSSPKLATIDHTEVADALKGQGAGRKLLDALVAWARDTGTKVVPVCPYARAQFDKDRAIRDVLST